MIVLLHSATDTRCPRSNATAGLVRSSGPRRMLRSCVVTFSGVLRFWRRRVWGTRVNLFLLPLRHLHSLVERRRLEAGSVQPQHFAVRRIHSTPFSAVAPRFGRCCRGSLRICPPSTCYCFTTVPVPLLARISSSGHPMFGSIYRPVAAGSVRRGQSASSLAAKCIMHMSAT